MPAKIVTVNLLEKDELQESPIGRIISWATTYGRYIMITTEIIVLAAFVSRFSLDRKRNDLAESISQKQAIIEANQPFEKDIRTLQWRLTTIDTILANQSITLNTLTDLKQLLPADVYFESYSWSGAQLSVKAVAGTIEGFTVFMNNLQANSRFSEINLGDVKKQSQKGITFSFTATLANPPQQINVPKPPVEPEKSGKGENI